MYSVIVSLILLTDSLISSGSLVQMRNSKVISVADAIALAKRGCAIQSIHTVPLLVKLLFEAEPGSSPENYLTLEMSQAQYHEQGPALYEALKSRWKIEEEPERKE